MWYVWGEETCIQILVRRPERKRQLRRPRRRREDILKWILRIEDGT